MSKILVGGINFYKDNKEGNFFGMDRKSFWTMLTKEREQIEKIVITEIKEVM